MLAVGGALSGGALLICGSDGSICGLSIWVDNCYTTIVHLHNIVHLQTRCFGSLL